MQGRPHMISPYLTPYRGRNPDPRSSQFQPIMQDTVFTSEFHTRLWETRHSGRQDVLALPSLLHKQAVASVAPAMDGQETPIRQSSYEAHFCTPPPAHIFVNLIQLFGMCSIELSTIACKYNRTGSWIISGVSVHVIMHAISLK